MNPKCITLLILVCATALFNASASQTLDERMGTAIAAHDWFTLDSLYYNSNKDSIHPFIEVFSRCLIGNRLNRTDVSIPAFEELLNKHSESLDLGNLVSSAFMFGMDLSRSGNNKDAATMMRAVTNAAKQYLDSTTISGLTATANRYESLSSYSPYRIDFGSDSLGVLPFRIVPVGPAEKGSVLMHLEDSYINGKSANITFDTGAGINMISPQMVEKYNLVPLENTLVSVHGVNVRDGCIAMAKELKIGNMTIKDVPFSVLSLSSGNEEADKFIDCFNIVVGSELMLQLKDVTLDFTNRIITAPAKTPSRSGAKPNMCFSPTMNILTKGTVLSQPMMMCLDSGSASYGSLGKIFFTRNSDYVTANGELSTVKEAGIAGVIKSECYNLHNIPVDMGGHVVFPGEMPVKLSENAMMGDYDCTIGVKTMMLYDKVRFNLVDFVLSTELPARKTSMQLFHNSPKTPSFNCSPKVGPSLLQTLGITAIGVARTLLYPSDAPTSPDL